jgi:hypothetical protein
MSKTTNKFSPEVRSRAVRLVRSFRGSSRISTKLNHEDVAAPQGLTRPQTIAGPKKKLKVG